MEPSLCCPRCSGSLEPGSRFCQNCGLNLSGDHAVVPGTPAGTGTGVFQLPRSQVDLLREATLGEYDILGELGTGGMATVYLAHDIALNRKVAIKLMSPAYLHGPEMVARFKREARTAAALSHPQIIPVYAVREGEQVLFFVMKYVKGRTLDSIIAELGPLPLPMIRSILLEVAVALDYAHREGVVHRDIKPGNIMVDEEGFVVVTDFGIAKAMQGDTLTMTGTTVGTPSYLSPEACIGGSVSPASDQYSLGAVAYEMLTGRPPFEAETSMAMMYAQVHTSPRPSSQIRSDAPAELNRIIMRMLEKNPADRFPSMHDMAEAVNQALPQRGDGVRTQIGLLARNRPNIAVEAARATPTSPFPGGRVISGGRGVLMPLPSVRRGAEAPKRAPDRRGLMVGGAAIGLGVAALLLAQPWKAPPTPYAPPAPTASPTDTLWLRTRGAAEYARQLAVTAGVPTKALIRADSLSDLAKAQAIQGQTEEAVMLMTTASGLYAEAQRSAIARAAAGSADRPPRPRDASRTAPPASGSTPVTGEPGPSAAAAPPGPGDSLQVAEYYAELKRAIDARQLGEIQRLLPNLTGKEEGQWRKLFEDRKVTGIEAAFFVREVTVQGDEATAHVIYDLTITREAKSNMRQQDQTVLLSRGPRGWRQIRADDVP